MFTTSGIGICELHRRTADGIDVRLWWDSRTNRIYVSVEDDRREESFELEVEPSRALDAFRHPFAYAAGEVEGAALAA
jgi:hypothetical protein